MANKAWLELTWKDSGKKAYCETSRSKTYPESSTRQLQRARKFINVTNPTTGFTTVRALSSREIRAMRTVNSNVDSGS